MTDQPTAVDLTDLMQSLDPARQHLARQFIVQILQCHDPDVVGTFLEWRRDPCIDSLLVIAASLEPDYRDQLLFAAEDLFSEQEIGKPKASA
ncbi:hypothetical protein DKT77_18520 [Meridianimarinicoccus roseus]|jgi:hypothetical protein|uniref:Uncharacterized protein n=1 Tax=Meridianimarinicoccus roseus TaxID=2072018 RepID=A0A2V2LGX5_9RHOB|nr:hypothetical protein [Meridianimarinicoccus roseus]PWR01153.1 hypothetical protein DKT77_18520 [Meridianimarinicoccus roseus]